MAAPHAARRSWWALLLLIALFFFSTTPTFAQTPADCLAENTLDDLVGCVKTFMALEGSDAYAEPGPALLADWQRAVTDLLGGACSPMALPASLTSAYTMAPFQDGAETYCVLLETTDADADGTVDHGWGTVVFNPDPNAKLLSIDIPHPLNDTKTPEQGIAIFKGVQARTYVLAGSHRRANPVLSGCQDDYHLADAAHNEAHTFQATLAAMNDLGVPFTSIQFHGMGEHSCGDVDVYITHGTKRHPLPNSLADQLKQGFASAIPAGWNWTVTIPGDNPSCNLSGTQNTQGRLLNGIAPGAVCETQAWTHTGRFVHIEQKRHVRADSVHAYWITAINGVASNQVPDPIHFHVTSPNGGENWELGTPVEVTWDHQGSNANVNLALYKDGDHEKTIVSSTANDGFYAWTVDDGLEAGSDYTVRIKSTDDGDYRDYSDFPFSIAAGSNTPTLTVFSPNGGESIERGAEMTVTWATQNVPGDVDVTLFKEGSYYKKIVDDTANDGSYTWFVPFDLPEGSTYTVRVRSEQDSGLRDYSDAAFDILTGPSSLVLTLTSPNGGETLEVGGTYAITWDTQHMPEDVHLAVFKNGSYRKRITSSTANDGHYEWTIPNSLTPDDDYTIRVRSTVEHDHRDYSDVAFSIALPLSKGTSLAAELPAEVALGQNYPNPFNPITTIRYALPVAAPVTLTIHDLLGREVARLVDGAQAAGMHVARFDASQLASGLYLYRLQVGTQVETRRMTLLK